MLKFAFFYFRVLTKNPSEKDVSMGKIEKIVYFLISLKYNMKEKKKNHKKCHTKSISTCFVQHLINCIIYIEAIIG